MGITLTRSTDICTCARLLPDVYRSLERKSRRERSLCHLQIISMINCSGNKIPLTCVFAAIAIVFIHGLSLVVAPSEPELREAETRAWATAENEPARPKAGVVFLMYDDSGNSCCSYKGNKLSCDYTGDSSDMDFICECWP